MTTDAPVKYSVPEYVKQLARPRAAGASERKVWSIGLDSKWVPYFTATNTAGVTAVSPAALGAPLRPAKDKSGAVRFGTSGKVQFRVEPELNASIMAAKENFEASLVEFAKSVQAEHPDEYRAQAQANAVAAAPVMQQVASDIADAQAKREALAKAADEAAKIAAQPASTESNPADQNKPGLRVLPRANANTRRAAAQKAA